jgi:hypothetical protein
MGRPRLPQQSNQDGDRAGRKRQRQFVECAKDVWSEERHKKPAGRAAGGNHQVKQRQKFGPGLQRRHLSMANHAANEKSRKIQGNEPSRPGAFESRRKQIGHRGKGCRQ